MRRKNIFTAGIIIFAVLSPAASLAVNQSSVDRLISSHSKHGSPAISVVVVIGGKAVYRKTLGFSDIENEIAASPKSVIEVGSVSKMFTAFAVERLIASGTISGDDDARKYLPNLPIYSAPITLRNLLQHTSGLRDYFELLAMRGIRFDDSVTQQEVVDLIERQKEINFVPGTDYNYTNSEYVLLAQIVEKVTGRPFGDYISETIFKPFGMEGAQIHSSRVVPIVNIARSYIGIGQGRVIALPFNSDVMGPSGAWMTPDDLAKWIIGLDKAVANGDAAVAAMVKPTVLAGGKTLTSGEGIFHGEHNGFGELYHDGGDSGYRSVAMLFPDQHIGIAIEANSPSDDLIKLSEEIADEYLPTRAARSGDVNGAIEGNRNAHSITEPDLRGLAGNYYSDELDTSYSLHVDGNKLFADHLRNGSITLTSAGKDSWTGDQWWCKLLTVERDEGKVTGFRLAGFRTKRGVLFERQ